MNTLISKLKNRFAKTTIDKPHTLPTSTSIAETTNFQSGKHDEPIVNEELTGTPFRIIYLPGHGWFIALGLERISEKFYNTRKEAIKPVQERDYKFLYNFIVTTYLAVHKFHQETEKQ